MKNLAARDLPCGTTLKKKKHYCVVIYISAPPGPTPTLRAEHARIAAQKAPREMGEHSLALLRLPGEREPGKEPAQSRVQRLTS